MTSFQAIAERFTAILDKLRLATDSSRTTLRIDIDEAGFHVDDPAAEAAGSGVSTLLGMTALKQRDIDTVKWLDEHRIALVQNETEGAIPAPPDALIKVYGVKAQMLAPIVRGDKLVGWISVHENRKTRNWQPDHVALLEAAVDEVHAVLDGAGFKSLGDR
ncbi:MAG: GAF domain-containing protein [Hyphomicrobiales bacterium]